MKDHENARCTFSAVISDHEPQAFEDQKSRRIGLPVDPLADRGPRLLATRSRDRCESLTTTARQVYGRIDANGGER
jgi:hypothetical protein